MKETSAKKILRESWIGQSEKYDIAERASARFAAELVLGPRAVDAKLREKISQVHEAERLIGVQREKLSKLNRGLDKDVRAWEATSSNALSKLREAGDLQNWAEIIDGELRVIEETVRIRDSRRGR